MEKQLTEQELSALQQEATQKRIKAAGEDFNDFMTKWTEKHKCFLATEREILIDGKPNRFVIKARPLY